MESFENLDDKVNEDYEGAIVQKHIMDRQLDDALRIATDYGFFTSSKLEIEEHIKYAKLGKFCLYMDLEGKSKIYKR